MKHSSAILLENAHQTTGELALHISKYDEHLGELVMLLEINDAGEETKKIIKHIIEDSEYHYFHSIAREPEKALEDALQKVNFGISEMLKYIKQDWLPRSSLLIAASFDGEAHFARVGAVSAFLISKGDGSDEITQITENAPSEPVNPVKVFSNIYSGTLPKEAAILFISDSILDYVSQEKLRKIASENSPKQAVAELKTILKKAPGTKMFGAVINKVEEDKADETREWVSSKPKEPEVVKKTPRPYQKPERKLENKDKQYSMNKKIVLAVTIATVAVIGAVQLIGRMGTDEDKNSGKNKGEATATPSYEEIAANVQAKFIEAQNYLIADKKNEAKQALLQTNTLIAGLPEDTPERVKEKQTLAKKVKTQLLLAEGVELTTPTLLAELVDISAVEIIRKGEKFFLIDIDAGTIYEVSVLSPQLIKVELTTTGEIGKIVKTIDETGESILLYHELPGLAEFQIQKKTMKALEWNRSWKEEPRASDIYQNKLYAIAPGGKIFKYTRAITGFTQEASWLKEGVPSSSLEDATDIAIDSALWVLKGNGEILKFFKGVQEQFSFTITPALKKPIKLFTDLGVQYLYILEADTNRIVILGKDGKLITQFTAEEFSNVKDFAVDESGKKIYVLDEGAVFLVRF